MQTTDDIINIKLLFQVGLCLPFFFFLQVSHLKTLPISTPLASIYVKIFGQEVAFANINAAFVNQLVLFKPQPQIQSCTIKLLLQEK